MHREGGAQHLLAKTEPARTVHSAIVREVVLGHLTLIRVDQQKTQCDRHKTKH
jgi:hypothetical protein